MDEITNQQVVNQGIPSRSQKFLKPRNLIFLILIIGIAALGFYFWQKGISRMVKPSYSQTYRLVSEKVSQSAVIQINLPPNVDKSFAKNNIKFNPEIEGEWLAEKEGRWVVFAEDSAVGLPAPSENSDIILFKPKEKLNLNRYYAVELAMSDGGLVKSDFLAVEDPEITAIFPKKDSETPENSEITIVFNRPMVPLTTLGYLEEKEVPVEITPFTEGRFKWITTRNLQFIPKERLIRSSYYKVKINPGLISMDGLGIPGTETGFITRKLRYLNLSEGLTVYNQPISIYFNQPVDLEKTKGEISLRDNTTGKEIPFIVEYESKAKSQEVKKDEAYGLLKKAQNFLANISTQFGFNLFPEKETAKEINKSVLKIYNQKDRFDREKFWDFEHNYSLIINKAYPLEGEIILDEKQETNISVPRIIASMSAESARTNYATPSFFDPQGKLWVNFYEEIDLDKSEITVPKLKDIGYGEKCKDETLSSSADCEKITDKKKIYITFKSEEIGLAEKLEINFQKIVNFQGLTINKEPIRELVISYPEFKILSTSPVDNSVSVNLTEFVFCSNSPILTPAKEDYKKYLKASLDYEVNSWQNSWRVERVYEGEKCKVGEFHTSIYYGLMPQNNYSLEFNLEDVFGQKLSYSLKFTTGLMPSESLNFYHLQNSYNVTSPAKTRLTFGAQNMEYVNLEICKLESFSFLKYLEDRPDWDESFNTLNCQKIINDKIELPKKYWIINYFKVDLKDYFEDPLGHYILTFSHPNYTTYTWDRGMKFYKPVYQRSYLTVTNLAVAEKRINSQSATYGANEPLNAEQLKELRNLYWVTSISNLEPISDAKVDLYRTENLNFAGSYSTNNQGIALTDVVADIKGVIITKDKDSTVIPIYQSNLNWADSAFSAKNIYLYTDKPIYGPSQEVFIKGIYRIGYDGNYEIYQDKKVNLRAYNSRGDEILNSDLEVNDFGTFNTKLILEKNAPLGNYRICVDKYSCYYFDVQEYVPAPFEVKVASDKEEYISKDTVNLDIEANYYFGTSLEGGEVNYTVSSQNYYFDRYSDGYFDFDSGWYYWLPYPYGDKFILRGKTELSTDGKAKISETLDLEKLFKNKEDRESKIIVVDITVKNPQGQSVSSQKSFILHAGEFYLGLNADKRFLRKDEKFNLKVKSVDTQGKEAKVRDITLALYKTDWIYAKRQEATGGYSYIWEKKRELIEKYNFDTDSSGNYTKELKISKEGEYEFEVSAQDKRNNLVWSTYNLYVYGEGAVTVKPTKDTELEVTAEKTALNVGDEGKILIKSPYPNAKALISIERGKIFDYQIKEVQGNLYNFNFQVKEEYLPNVYVSVLLQSTEPGVKFGQVGFQINTERQELNIEVKSNKTHYLPGEEVTLDILAKDFEGKPASAELSLSVVDLSVLALKGNPKKNPLIFFYSGFPLTVQTGSNLKNILVEIPILTKGGGGGEGLAKKVRGIFKETAFWQAVVRTDENGKAQIKFTLPDNLTTWQTETIGITKDTKVGVNYQEFMTQKELMLLPLKPRFVVPGDVFYIGAKIFNQSQEKQKLNIKFESQSLVLEDDSGEKKVTIDSGKTETVYFKVRSPNQIESGEHKFLLSAKSEKLEDTVIQYVEITPNNTYEVTATANYTTEKISKEYVFLPDNVVKDKGNLSIKSSATLAVFLSDALNYLIHYPYGCSEQIASQLDAIAIVKKGLNLPNLGDKLNLQKVKYEDKEYSIEELVDIGLAKLYDNQGWNGGFYYWKHWSYEAKPDFYLTLHVVDTLHNLSLAGFPINQNSLNRAADYLRTEISKGRWQYESEGDYKNRLILTTYTLFRLPNFKENEFLKQEIIRITNDNLFLQEQISNSSLSYLAILLSRGQFNNSLKNKVFDVLDNRINIDARGAFLEPNQNFLWYYYETPIKDTALYLKTLAIGKSSNPILDKVLRWLLNSREKDGAWGSTNNTLTVVDAFTDFLEWKRETESNFNLDLSVNNKSEGTFNFNPDTILDQFKKELPLSDLKFNENNVVQFSKNNNNELPNALYYDMALKYYLPVDQIPPRDEGFSITRAFYSVDDKENKTPLQEAKVGEVLRANLQITVPKSRNFMIIEDYIPAGMEIVNLELATEQKSLLLQEKEIKENNRELYPNFTELHDDRAFVFKERIEPGVYEFDYYVRALTKGKFTHLPAVVSEMYFPENFGRTAGSYFEIK